MGHINVCVVGLILFFILRSSAANGSFTEEKQFIPFFYLVIREAETNNNDNDVFDYGHGVAL